MRLQTLRTRPSDARKPSRRELLQIGYSAMLGVSLQGLLSSRAVARPSPASAKSVLFIFLTGGPSHVDTFDPKPEAPAGYRGEFEAVQTSVPAIRVCEHLRKSAERMDRLAIVRSMRCSRRLGAHHLGTQAILTGINELPAGVINAATRHDWPCYAAGLDFCRPRSDGVPNGVLLPQPAYDSTLGVYSGQNAGFLGARHDPWLIKTDPTDRSGDPGQPLALPPGFTLDRLESRRSLVAALDQQKSRWESLAREKNFDAHHEQAYRILASGRLAKALNLEHEPPRTRDQYGPHFYGRSLLLARRLLQAGAPIVQVNLAEYSVQWDTHADNCKTLKRLLPPLDQAIAALLDDMAASGLLEETFIILTGEFGRTPKLGGFAGQYPTGRDHWMDCFSTVFAGGGVRGGQVIGGSDKTGAEPVGRAYSPSDLGATVYTVLGVDPATQIRDTQGRPFRLNEGERIAALFG